MRSRSAARTLNDEALRDKLRKRWRTDRVGYGTTAFNSINLEVQNGVVTLSGTVYGPTDKDSVLSLVSQYAGGAGRNRQSRCGAPLAHG